MSREIHIESLKDEDIDIINKELEIVIEPGPYDTNSKPTFIYPMDISKDGSHAYIPFAYGRTCAGGPYDRPDISVSYTHLTLPTKA